MGQPKTGKTNNLDHIAGSTGANVVSSSIKTRKQKIMHKTTGEKPAEPAFAKASPNFKEVKPDEKIVASEEAQKKAIEENVIDESNDPDDDSNDQD